MPTGFTFSYNGLSMGVNTPYSITSLVGIDDMPALRKSDVPKADAHGAYRGLDVLDVRVIQIEAQFVATSQPDYDAKIAAIASAWAVQANELPFIYTLGDTTVSRQINCRPAKRVIPREPRRWGMSGVAHLELIASDPRLYAATLSQLSTGLASTAGGLTFNVTFNVTFGTSGAGGTVALLNAGNFITYPVFTITGPVTNPIIDNLTTGATLNMALTLSNTDVLVVDTDAHTITLNGTANRYYGLSTASAWSGLLPGTTTLRYRNNGAFTASTATVAWRSAWL